jgi:hypothetical protein
MQEEAKYLTYYDEIREITREIWFLLREARKATLKEDTGPEVYLNYLVNPSQMKDKYG